MEYLSTQWESFPEPSHLTKARTKSARWKANE